MKLFVNGAPLLTPLTGIGRYTWQLCQQMAHQSDIDLLMARAGVPNSVFALGALPVLARK